MLYAPDPYDAHVTAVQSVDVDPPLEWSQRVGRFQDYLNLDAPMAQRLAMAVVDGPDEDIATLHALALAETTAMPPARATVDHTVRTAVMTRLRELYAPHAAPNYQQVGADFDSLAHRFTAAAGLVDPETPAVDMVSASEKTRKAWATPARVTPRSTPSGASRYEAARWRRPASRITLPSWRLTTTANGTRCT
jgi:hypothetical protein